MCENVCFSRLLFNCADLKHRHNGTNLSVCVCVTQVVRNLVTNACKFTPSGGTIAIEGEVLLAAPASPHGASSGRSFSGSSSSLSLEKSVPSFAATQATRCGYLRVKVSDTGVGIKAHNKDKLFHQFQQFDKNQLQSGGGSGLGLWISHYIVDCHGGKLQFESLGPGKGSVFFFDLPLYHHEQSSAHPAPNIEMVHWPATHIAAEDQSLVIEEGILEEEGTGSGGTVRETRAISADSCPQPHTTSKAPSTPATPRKRMDGSANRDHKQMAYLLVDDSKGNRRMLRRMLESDTSIPVSSVQEAEDGVDAVKIVAEAGSASDKPPIDCIFMDSVMNQMHGPETVKHLRSKLGFTGKILGLTGNAMEDDVKHFQQAGLDLLLIKPLKKVGLLEALAAQGLMPTQQAPTQAPIEGLTAPATPAAEDTMDGDAKGDYSDRAENRACSIEKLKNTNEALNKNTPRIREAAW